VDGVDFTRQRSAAFVLTNHPHPHEYPTTTHSLRRFQFGAGAAIIDLQGISAKLAGFRQAYWLYFGASAVGHIAATQLIPGYDTRLPIIWFIPDY